MKNIDLTKCLKVGDVVYSIISDKEIKVSGIDLENTEFPISIGSFAGKGKPRRLNRYGSVLLNGTDSLIFPSKEVLSWENYSPFVKGDIVLAYNDIEGEERIIGIYSHYEDGVNYIFRGVNAGKYFYEGFNVCEYVKL